MLTVSMEQKALFANISVCIINILSLIILNYYSKSILIQYELYKVYYKNANNEAVTATLSDSTPRCIGMAILLLQTASTF